MITKVTRERKRPDKNENIKIEWRRRSRLPQILIHLTVPAKSTKSRKKKDIIRKEKEKEIKPRNEEKDVNLLK